MIQTKPLKMTNKQMFEMLDAINAETLKYVGIQHLRSGCREEVNEHKKYIQSLNAKPIYEIEIIPQTTHIDNDGKFIVINLHSYVNVYFLKDIEHKIKSFSFTKKQPIGIIQ